MPVPRIIQEIPEEIGVQGAILMEFFPGTLLNQQRLMIEWLMKLE